MRIVSIQIRNYKSFLSSPEIQFKPGFNVIVGQNNAGKTALAEALSLQFKNHPHRSMKTVPQPSSLTTPESEVKIAIGLDKGELLEFFQSYLREFNVPVRKSGTPELDAEKLLGRLQDQCVIRYTLQQHVSSWGFTSAEIVDYTDEKYLNGVVPFKVNFDSMEVERVGNARQGYNPSDTFVMQLSHPFKNRIYMFNAERLRVGEAEMNLERILASDASNLAQVLHLLQSRNDHRFKRLNEYVRTIFPDINQVRTFPEANYRVRIFVWTIDPSTEREDLATPLSESGTGIGQVLAILYVVLTSDYPRTIIIDEPQSFLHPGAVRKLFDILKQHPQHQYIITTHSPTAVTAANPQTILMVRKEGGESTIEAIDVKETNQLRLFLTEVGARLSDVFGADNILWVEGRTEELCFPMILSEIDQQPLFGTAIMGVVQTGDFEGKHSKTIFEIYERLSQGRGLLPPAIGFIFDQEGRTETEQQDLMRQSEGRVSFLPRRMYENYLLNPHAIVEVARRIEGFRETPLTDEEVAVWFEQHRWDSKYFDAQIATENQRDEIWIEKVHGAKVLNDIFTQLSETRIVYDKIEHGLALTQWTIKNSPDDLREIAELIKSKIGTR